MSGNMTIEEIKRRTRCRRCQEIGHWKRECPNPPKAKPNDNRKPNETHYLSNTTEAIFVGMLEHDWRASSSNDVVSDFDVNPNSGLNLSKDYQVGSESAGVYKVSDQPETRDIGSLFVFENWFCDVVKSNTGISIHEETCATVDTGCQRLAIGSETRRSTRLSYRMT